MNYIKRNIERFLPSIQGTIQDLRSKYDSMRDLKTSGFWGGEETIMETAELQSANIRIFQEDGT